MRSRFLVSSLTIAVALLVDVAMVEQGLAGCSCTKQPAIYGKDPITGKERPACSNSECYVFANFGKPGRPERKRTGYGTLKEVVKFAAGQQKLEDDEIE